MKILIVDDNHNDRQVLRYTVEAHGHDAIVAGDGEEGLRMAVMHMPDLIISDVFMPGMDGFQFLRNLKTISSIPFIFYSAVYKGNEDVQLAHSLGAEAYIIKPKEPVELWEEIALIIGTDKKERAVPAGPVEEDADYLKRYSHVVAAKLEEKVTELEATLAERELVVEALSESEKRYKQLLGSVTDYIYTVHVRDGRPVATVHGPGCAAVTGYTSEEYTDDPDLWYRMVYAQDRDAVAEQVVAILAGEAALPLEHRIVHKDNSIRWVRNTPVPHFDERRHLVAYDGLIADITDRKRAEDDYRTILRTAMDGFLLLDMDGRILDVNDSYCKLTGYGRDELLKLAIHDVDALDSPEEVKRRIERIRAAGSVRFETRHRHKSGALIDFDVSVNYLPDNGGRMVSFSRDITEKRNLERELFEAKRLEIIGHLAGGVAHEVRNPLNAILSISEALFREKEIAGNSEYLPYIGHIRAQIGRLSKLMTDLLDLGKPIKPSSITGISLPKLCADTIALWSTTDAARLHPVALILDDQEGSLSVNADDARLQQVLLNLLDNAAQNSPDMSGITLRVAIPEGHRVAVRITDAGRGIPQEKIGRIFEPFFTSRRAGTGLGLTLVKHFVENMGGEVHIFNNEPPPGCTAELILNLTPGRNNGA
jgi:PAS domain S-box-containing protein